MVFWTVKVNSTVCVPNNICVRNELFKICRIYQLRNKFSVMFGDDECEETTIDGRLQYIEAVLLEYNEQYNYFCWALTLRCDDQTTTNILLRPDFRQHMEAGIFDQEAEEHLANILQEWKYGFDISGFSLTKPWHHGDKKIEIVWVPILQVLATCQCKVSVH